MIKRILINLYFIVLGLCSLALTGFFCYVVYRRMTAPPFFNVNIIPALATWVVVAGFAAGLAGIAAAIFVRRPFLDRKFWAKATVVAGIILSIFLLWLGREAIKDIERWFYMKSSYRAMFMYGAWPLLVATVLLVVGWVWPREKKAE